MTPTTPDCLRCLHCLPFLLSLADDQRSPPVTAKNVASFLEAMLLSPRVSPEVEAQRLAICEKCDKRKTPALGEPFCGMCGCQVSREGWRVRDLTHYEENLPKWGCKHPLRSYKHKITNQEYGWPLPKLDKSD